MVLIVLIIQIDVICVFASISTIIIVRGMKNAVERSSPFNQNIHRSLQICDKKGQRSPQVAVESLLLAVL